MALAREVTVWLVQGAELISPRMPDSVVNPLNESETMYPDKEFWKTLNSIGGLPLLIWVGERRTFSERFFPREPHSYKKFIFTKASRIIFP